MTKYKVFDMNTTAGKRWSFGLFDNNGELLAGRSQPYYKTLAGAEKAMKKQMARK